MVAGLSTQLDTISAQMKNVQERLDEQDTNFERLENLIKQRQSENSKLKEENLTQKQDIIELKEHINRLEQRNRANCVRVFNLPISGDSSNNDVVAEEVYKKALLPILVGAANKGRLPGVPSVDKVIEVAHILPGKKDLKPVLVRFRKPIYKLIIMQLKRELAPRAASKNEKPGPGPMLYSIFDDTTRDTYQLMRKLATDSRVEASWFVGGSLKFRLVDSDTVHRVRSIFGEYEDNFPTNN